VDVKGSILTGFVDWLRARYDDDFADDVIDATALASGGAYTAVGEYPYTDLVALAMTVADREGVSGDDVLRDFARQSFGALAGDHSFLLFGIEDGLRLLEVTESHIHVEVLALYPDTRLPTIETRRLSDGGMELTYSSLEPLAAMCEGRILGALDLFDDDYVVACIALDPSRRAATYRITPATSVV
jgi:hypothetical protein